MATQLKDGLSILFDTIKNNLRHFDYDLVKKTAEDYTTYATGLNIKDKLKQFNGRESEDEFQQRLLITQINTPDIFRSCIKPLYKVGRTPAAVMVQWQGKDAAKTTELKKELFEAGKNFWGKRDVTKYITQRVADLEATDPNSWIIVEFSGNVDPTKPETKARPYPFEANAKEAINFKIENNETLWLVVLNKIKIKDKNDKEHDGEKYYTYIDNESITATQIHKDLVQSAIQGGVLEINDALLQQGLKPGVEYLYNTGDKAESKRRYYVIKIYEHKIGFVPAKRVGCTFDETTRNRTCVPIVFAAQSYFEKSIQVMSEFDLTNRCHVWPKLFQYADPCPGDIVEGNKISCVDGYRPDGKIVCGKCKGSGFKLHTSSQSVIQIRFPRDSKDIIPLENLMAIKAPPMDLITFQKEYGFEDLRRYACRAVYNSDVFSQEQIQQTATSKVIDLDAVYDTLMPFADNWSEFFVFIYRCIAALRDINKELSINHEFPKDFKMQSVTQLLDDLAKANKSGAPSHVIKAITKDITNKIYADQPHKVLVIDTKDKYFPFPGKTESEINFIIANDLTTVYNKVLYAHFDLIFSEIEFEQSQSDFDFYQMDEKKQRELLDEKVAELTEEIEEDNASAAAEAFKTAVEPDIEKTPAIV